MAMRKAFTGGACAPGGEGQELGNNALTNFMDYMISGGANAGQMAEGFGPQMDSQNMASMEAAFGNQEKMEAMQREFEAMNMNQQYMGQMPMPQMSQPNITQMNDLWDNPVQSTNNYSTNDVADRFVGMSHGPQMFGPPGMMNPMMHQNMNMYPRTMAPEYLNQEEAKVEELPTETIIKEDPQMYKDEMKETTAALINQLNQVPSQKVQNSEFLTFLKKLNAGALEIDKNGLKEDATKLQNFDTEQEKVRQMDAEWHKNRIDAIIEETKDPEYYKEEDAIKQKDFISDFDPQSFFKDAWDAGEMKEDEMQSMMAGWKSMAEKSMNYYSENFEEPPVETIIEIPKVDHLKFDGNNPYENVDDAYELALQFNDQLKVHDAVLALQAHLTKEPDHAASWRLLGQLYQEKDEDNKAIHYFLRAYELDPYDCDSLLCLGVS